MDAISKEHFDRMIDAREADPAHHPGTQPPHANLSPVFQFTASGYSPITIYKLLSTNDYYANLTVQVRGKTSVTNTAAVSSDSPDPEPSNNSVSITTKVGAGKGNR